MVEKHWNHLSHDPEARQVLSPIAAASSWRLERWDSLQKYSDTLDSSSEKALFYKSVLAIRNGDTIALRRINETRVVLDATLPALMSESIGELIWEC